MQHLALVSANNRTDGVIICSFICTDPEYLLFVKIIQMLLVSVSYMYDHVT